jgi:hypothetical protein
MADAENASTLEGLGRALRNPLKLNRANRLAIDAFAERYAAGRGLEHAPTGETPPAAWFLETVIPARSHSFLCGSIGGGAPGRLFFAERPRAAGRGRVMDGWTVALYEIPEARRLAYGLVCLWRPGTVWGGRVQLNSPLPQDLIEQTVGEPRFDERYRVAVRSQEDWRGVHALFSPGFVAWMNELPWENTGGTVTRFELRNGTLCVYMREKVRTAEALDAFAERAAHIAARILAASGAHA